MKKMIGILAALIIQTGPAGADDLDALFYRLTVGCDLAGSPSAAHPGCLKHSADAGRKADGRTGFSATHIAFNFAEPYVKASPRAVPVRQSRDTNPEKGCIAEKQGKQTACRPASEQFVTEVTGGKQLLNPEKSARRYTFPLEAMAIYDPPTASFSEPAMPVKINRAAKGNRIALEEDVRK